MSKFMNWLKTLHPLYNRRMARLDIVRSITLPYGNLEGAWRGRIRTSIHPDIDHFLTFDERIELLIKYKWMENIPGTDRYISPVYIVQLKTIGDHINKAEWRHKLKDEFKVYNCGIEY